jgi:hypothetical protein
MRVTRPVQLNLLLIIGQYLVRSTGQYAVSSTSQLSLPFYAVIPSSAPHSQLPNPMFLSQCDRPSFTPI